MVDFRAGAQAVLEEYLPEYPSGLPSAWAGEQVRAVAYPVIQKAGETQASITSPLVFQTAPDAKPVNLLVPDVQKIAVLRCNGLGDFLFALPAIEAVRAAYPQAEIVYLGLDWHKQFLTGRIVPIDRVEVVPPSRGVSYPEDFTEEDQGEMDDFFRRMNEENFDLAIQMHGGGRFSNPFVHRLGARMTVGLRSPDAIPLARWVPYNYFQFEIHRYLEVVSLIGAAPVTLEPRIQLTAADLEEAESIYPSTGRPVAVLHPGAGDARRRWPVEKFAAVGNALGWAGADVVVVGSDHEWGLVNAVLEGMAIEAGNLCGQTSLGGLAGLLSRASVLVSNDSGPLHLASAVGAPTVGIYWCGNMITAGQVTRSRHRPVISWQLDCPVCGLDCTRSACGHHVSFVDRIPVSDVIASALELAGLAEPSREDAYSLNPS